MLRHSLPYACFILCLCLLPACSSTTTGDNTPVADETAEPAAAARKKTPIDDQLKALDDARAVEATLEEAKAARDKAIDEASGG